MFPTSSSQSHHSTGGGSGDRNNLHRYASAPTNLLTNAVGSISTTRDVGFQTHLCPTARYFPSSDNSEPMASNRTDHHGKAKTEPSFKPSSAFAPPEASSSSLARHNSSPPGLINQLATGARDDHGIAMRPWDDGNMFSMSQTKHDIVLNPLHHAMDSQFQFSLGMMPSSMEKLVNSMNIPQDSVPCKIRAKRGCATHPRSIAERERRTRISGKLKKLQDLVPNMDKQTSYADMLDLAVQHIKTLQTRVQKLNSELEGCTCGCKGNNEDS